MPDPDRFASDDLLDVLVGSGYDALTGVPCSLFGDLFERAAARDDVRLLPAAREDLAVGVAVGAALTGAPAVVAMQNSAIGMVLNATQSLAELYKVPVLLLVSWRGEGPDAPEHVAMGARMLDILDRAGVPTSFAADVVSGRVAVPDIPGPAALLVRKGEVAR